MNLTLPSWLQLPRPSINSVSSRGRVSRRVGLLGATPRDPKVLLRLLFETEFDGVPPLQPDEEAERLLRRLAAENQDGGDGNSDASASGAATIELPQRLLGMRLPSGERLGRSRAWELLPSGARAATDEDPITWERHSNVALIGWPWRLVGANTRDAKVRIGGSASVARRLGRLQRVALVIHGVPDERAPRHASQASFVFPVGQAAAAHLDRLMRESELRGGDALADPGWRETLRTVQGDSELMALVELLRRTVGADVLLFFTGERDRARLGFETLMNWVEDGTATTRARARGPARGLVTAAAALWLASLIALALSPIGCAERPPSVRASAAAHRASLAKAQAKYRLWGPVRILLPGSTSARPLVERAYQIADDRAWHDLRIARIDRAAQTAAAGADSITHEERWKRGSWLRTVLDSQLVERRTRLARQRRISNGGPIWDAELARAAVFAAMLSLRPRNAGFGGWTLPDQPTITALATLRLVSGPAVLDEFDRLLAAAPATPFYRAVGGVTAASDFGARAAYRGFEATVPRVDRLLVREEPGLRAADYYERWVQAGRLESSNDLRRFLRNSGPLENGTGQAGGEEGPLVLTFSVPGETHWHLDVDVPGVGRRVVAPGVDAGPDAPVSLTIPRGHLGMVLHVRVNRLTPDHVADSVYGPCPGSVGTTFEIEKDGTIASYGGTFFIVYTARALGSGMASGGGAS